MRRMATACGAASVITLVHHGRVFNKPDDRNHVTSTKRTNANTAPSRLSLSQSFHWNFQALQSCQGLGLQLLVRSTETLCENSVNGSLQIDC